MDDLLQPCLLISFVLLAIVICVLVVVVGKRVVSAPHDAQPWQNTPIDQHIRSTCVMLNGWRRTGDISPEQYSELRDLIEQQHPYATNLPERIPDHEIVYVGELKSRPAEQPTVPAEPPLPAPTAPLAPPAPSASAIGPKSGEISPADIVEAEIVEPENVEPRNVEPEIVPPRAAAPAPTATRGRAPWDFPDEPARPPRRPLSEVLAGFMQDKNIRWGELASGILIVGSAVGLVISLREQLHDTIPFFPALVFMLLTGAIQAAGIYTLRRWKLRTTSRGVLVIGLLLVPLNFLAACVLTGQGEDRRELFDPIYWIAITTGVTVFVTLTWLSGKYLLRAGQLPLAAAVLGCSVSQLVINRIEMPTSNWGLSLLGVPIVASFLAGVAYCIPNQWTRTRWTEPGINRLLLLLGLSAFALATAFGLVFFRVSNRLEAIVALSPAFCAVFSVTAWIGATVMQGTSSDAANNTHRITGTALLLVGLGFTAAAVISSLVNPTMLLASSIVSGVLLCGLAINRRMPTIMPGVWACLGAASLVVLNLLLNVFEFDKWTDLQQFHDATVSAAAGLCLTAVGFAIVGGMALMKRWGVGPSADSRSLKYDYASVAVAFALGCGLSLAASFVHKNNPFDVMTATILLVVIAVLAFVAATRLSHEGVPFLATALLVGALLHALVWNQWIAGLFTGRAVDIRWALLSVITAFCCSLAAMWLHRRGPAIESKKSFSACATVAIFATVVTGMCLIPQATGAASLILLAACVTALILAAATRGPETTFIFSATTALLMMTAVGEGGIRYGWYSSLQESRHIWIQLIGLATWSAVWLIAVALLRGQRWCNWLLRHAGPCEQAVLFGSTGLVTLLMAWGLSADVGAQIFIELPARPDTYVQLLDNAAFVVAALAAVAVAMIVALVIQPTPQRAGALIVMWCLAWSLSALPFESARGVGTALRWLLPIGGACAALLIGSRGRFIPAWHGMRQRLRLRESGEFSNDQWQGLINLSLTIVVFIVLLVSTLVTARTMLVSPKALGGPIEGSVLRLLPAEVSYGVPVGIIVATFLFYAVTERRGWLAVAGSAVFQYLVLLSIGLLFLSPHPELATERFVKILQSVSLGMTLYGFVWFAFLSRIGSSPVSKDWPIRQLDLHAIINAVLVGSLSVLIAQCFFWHPEQSAGWINEAGRPLGLVSLVLITVLAVVIWPSTRKDGILWLIGLSGMAITCIAASMVDRDSPPVSWWPLRCIVIGFVAVAVTQCVLAVCNRWNDWIRTSLPMLLVGVLGGLFAVRGSWDLSGFWLYFGMLMVLVAVTVVYGIRFKSSWPSLTASAAVLVTATMLVAVDPHSWFRPPPSQPYRIHVWVLSLVLLSLIWLGSYLWLRGKPKPPLASFVRLPNSVALLAAIWVAFAAFLEWLLRSGLEGSAIATPLGCGVIVGTFCLLLMNVWNDHARFRVTGRYLWTIGVAVAIAVVAAERVAHRSAARPIFVALALGVLTAMWAHWWRYRLLVNWIALRMRVPNPAATDRAMRQQIPVIHLLIAGLVVLIAVPGIVTVEPRWLHYLCALAVLPLAYGFGAFANRHVWLQWATLASLTLACLLLSWADLTPKDLRQHALSLPVRSFLVLAAGMFVYGAVLPRLINPENRWIPTIRHATVLTCVSSIGCFALLIALQAGAGSGMSEAEAAAVAVLVVGLIAGLISIAVLPRHDPLSLDLEGRMGYVYAAQVIAGGLVAHLFLSMPWLFQSGIMKYWPYIAIVLSFGGVVLANQLQKRDLLVLARPLFHTAAILPLSVAMAFRAVDSEADASLVMLLAGGIYMMIGVTRASLLSGAAAVVFGNLALWLLYNKFPAFEFAKHPQLWLIPPAISVLVAGQLNRHRLTASQLAGLRYMCMAVIYISSTCEIFIKGLGEQLWPPMLLALLSVAGIMLGIMMQVRAYLYLGSLFLLLSMVTMVSHAHRQFNHIWPWWVFGIALGIAILVFFGLFEKRRNEMTDLARKMSDWDY